MRRHHSRKLTRAQRVRHAFERLTNHRHYHHAHALAYLAYYGVAVIESHGAHLILAGVLAVFIGFNIVGGTDE